MWVNRLGVHCKIMGLNSEAVSISALDVLLYVTKLYAIYFSTCVSKICLIKMNENFTPSFSVKKSFK